ncbi:MAG: PepSY domain-containing protein [Acidithiobacillus ferrivorans]
MKSTSRHLVIALLVGTIGLASSTAAWAFEGQQYAKQARISPDKAEAIAMNASRPCGYRLSKGFFHPLQAPTIAKQTCPPNTAKVTGLKLVKASGGSGLHYVVDVSREDLMYTVFIDAKTEKLLEIKILPGMSKP